MHTPCMFLSNRQGRPAIKRSHTECYGLTLVTDIRSVKTEP